MENYLWLIVLLPAIGAVINLLIGKYLPKKFTGILACMTILASFVMSVIMFFQLLGLPADKRSIEKVIYSWIQIKSVNINLAFLVDQLSIIMMLVVSGVGFLIHVYSLGYMADEKRYSRYFGFLNLFAFAMLLLVMGNNLLVMFIGWEGVGLCSYLLIGFWFEKKENAVAGMKAFIVNRIGDFGFALGIFLLFWTIGSASGIFTIDFKELASHAGTIAPATATIIALLLFVGATGKSAQIPLYVWLPDAMAGPTPVSALIHAATMVTAGVYMIARMNFLFVLTPTAMAVVASVGVATAVFAGTIGLVQNDIKKVLAYSTISQLGYMFLGVGVGAFAAGIFHLMTHAFFKALLFLGSGSVIHGTGGEQDIRKMGGLRKYMPITFWTFLIATLAIAGIPGLSGFFSKDEILWKTFSNGYTVLWFVALLGAGLTALYMFRLVFLTFYGENRAEKKESSHDSHAHHGPAHESPKVMTIPLIILAVLSVIGGYVGIPYVLGGSNHIEHFMEPVFEKQEHVEAECDNGVCEIESSTTPLLLESSPKDTHAPADTHHADAGLEILLMVISVAVALFSIFIAYYLYIKRKEIPGKIAAKFPWLHKLLLNKYYIDEIYHAVFIKSLLKLNDILAYKIDLGIIDWIVNTVGKVTIGVAFASGWTDKTFVDGAVNTTGKTMLLSSDITRHTQTGNLKNYIAWATGTVVVLILVFLIFVFK